MNKAAFQFLVGAALLGMVGTVQAKGKSSVNIMCIGDSITHGFQTPSYRLPLLKILVDNGIEFTYVGVTEGNKFQEPDAHTVYRGVSYNNRHSAMSSQRAYETAGRINQSGRLGNSNVFGWLGLDKTYKGDFKIDPRKQMPDVCIILLGTNDTLSDWGPKGGIGAHAEEATKGLIGEAKGDKRNGKGDMDTIIAAIRKANSKARIYVMPVPTWSDKLRINNKAEDFAAIEQYNKEFEAWARQNKLRVIPVNEGLVDVTRQDKPFAGVDTLFNAKDHLHPTRQGDLIMAANTAKAMGIPGRTAGLERGAVTGDAKAARTVELRGTVGDGATNGWDTHNLVTLNMAVDGTKGVLILSEGGLKWNGNVLYSADFSANKEPIRVSFVESGNKAGVDGGFYVWLGDRLVGEALQGSPTADKNGYTLVTEQPVKAAASDKALAPLAPAKEKPGK